MLSSAREEAILLWLKHDFNNDEREEEVRPAPGIGAFQGRSHILLWKPQETLCEVDVGGNVSVDPV